MDSPLYSAIAHHSYEFLRWQIELILLALIGGLTAGVFVERGVHHIRVWRAALRAAMFDSVATPASALLLLQFIRHGSALLRSAALLKIALPVLAVWLLVRVSLRVSQRAFPGNAAVRYLVRGLDVVAWIGLLLYLSGAMPEIAESLDAVSVHIGAQRLTGWTLLQGVTWIAVTLVLALWLSSLLEGRLMASPLDINVRLVASRLVRAAIFTVALLVALQMVGIDLTVLGVFGGALGVGLGLGLQRIAANYVSGFVILLESSLRVGDNVRIDTFQGKILDIKTRYTVVRSPGGTESIVPNETLISSRVENLSYTDPNVWLRTTVSIDYRADLDVALPILARAAVGVPRVLASPAPSAVVSNFGSDGIEITVGFWISDPDNGALNVRGGVNLALWRALRDAGIAIPFPQRVLHWAEGAAPLSPPERHIGA